MIQIGNKVRTRYCNVNFVGVVKDIYDFERDKVYIVNIGGELVKRKEYELELLRDEPKQKPDEITISREEFTQRFIAALNPKRYSADDPTLNISIMVSGIMILHELENDLFGEK